VSNFAAALLFYALQFTLYAFKVTATSHQLVALVSALLCLTLWPVAVGPWLGILAVVAVMIGALTPDLDQPTANIWRRVLGGNVVGNVFQAFSGGHRHLTHSLIGIFGVGWLIHKGITAGLQPAVVPAALVVWRAFMIGYISHPIADTITDRGVPWLWPLPWSLRVPPGPEEVRVTTDSVVERFLVRGGLLLVGGLLLYTHWPIVTAFFHVLG